MLYPGRAIRHTTETDYPAEALIHELFEAQAARMPRT
jgi:hypothetical protein